MPGEGKAGASSEGTFYGPQNARIDSELAAEIRREAFGEEFGQESWRSAAEQAEIADLLRLASDSRVLDVACGAGGPSLALVERCGCFVTGFGHRARGDCARKRRSEEPRFGRASVFCRARLRRTPAFRRWHLWRHSLHRRDCPPPGSNSRRCRSGGGCSEGAVALSSPTRWLSPGRSPKAKSTAALQRGKPCGRRPHSGVSPRPRSRRRRNRFPLARRARVDTAVLRGLKYSKTDVGEQCPRRTTRLSDGVVRSRRTSSSRPDARWAPS